MLSSRTSGFFGSRLKDLRRGRKMRELRRLSQECLEDRRVLTTWAPLGNESLAEAAVIGELIQWQTSGERGALEKFESEAAAEQQLIEWSQEAFDDLFGEQVRNDFWWGRGHDFQFSRELRETVNRFGVSAATLAETATEFFSTDFLGSDPLRQGETGKVVSSADGSALYALHGNSLFVVEVNGEQSEVVQHFEFEGTAHEILVDGDNLVVVSTPGNGRWNGHRALSPNRIQSVTAVDLFDIAEPLQVRSVARATMDGGFREARLANGNLHLSVNSFQSLPLLGTVDSEDGSGLRYETEAEFLNRLSGQFLDSVTPSLSYAGGDSEVDLVDWDDFVHFGHWGSQAVTVASLDLSQELSLVDSEFVTQVGFGFDDLDADSMLIINQRPVQGEAEITQLSFEDGQWNAIASGSVAGRVLNESMVDEHNGLVRVATVSPIADEAGESDSWSSDLRVLEANGTNLQVIGELVDLADGQHLFGAFYAGDVVMLTTAEVEGLIPIFDPLHAIDLSDPENPVEVSQLDIPGVTTQLAAVDSTRLLGIGAVEGDDGRWRPQVSLYDATDLENLEVIQTWTGDNPTLPPSLGRLDGFWGQRGQMFDYDAATGTLVIDSPDAPRFWDRISVVGDVTWSRLFAPELAESKPRGPMVVQVDPDSEQVFTAIGNLDASHAIDVGTQGTLVFSLEYGTLIIGDRADLDSQVKVELEKPKAPPPPMVNDDRATVDDGGSVTIDVLSNDRLPEGATIALVSDAEFGTVSINDQNEIVYSDAQLPGNLTRTDAFTYTVELENGDTLTGEVRVTISPVADELEIQLAGALINQDGIAVDRVLVGEEYQLELSADWLGEDDQGIYQMIFEVVFDPAIFEVSGEPQALGGFENGRVVEASDTGFSAIGGFSGSLSPLGEGPQRIVSIPLRVIAEGSSTINIEVNPEDGPRYETLVFGVDVAIPDSQVSGSQLVIESAAAAAAMPQDVNSDGTVSASDALQIVNYLNKQQAERQAALAEGEASFSKLDVNRDGIVAASDVLAIINMLNERSRGEGEGSDNPIQDFYFEDIEKEKAGRSVFGPELLDFVVTE